jgi:hypothetical protein
LAIVTATEPSPSKFTDNVKPPVTNTAVTARSVVTEDTDAVSMSEFMEFVALIHLENAEVSFPTETMSNPMPSGTYTEYTPEPYVTVLPITVASTEPPPTTVRVTVLCIFIVRSVPSS